MLLRDRRASSGSGRLPVFALAAIAPGRRAAVRTSGCASDADRVRRDRACFARLVLADARRHPRTTPISSSATGSRSSGPSPACTTTSRRRRSPTRCRSRCTRLLNEVVTFVVIMLLTIAAGSCGSWRSATTGRCSRTSLVPIFVTYLVLVVGPLLRAAPLRELPPLPRARAARDRRAADLGRARRRHAGSRSSPRSLIAVVAITGSLTASRRSTAGAGARCRGRTTSSSPSSRRPPASTTCSPTRRTRARSTTTWARTRVVLLQRSRGREAGLLRGEVAASSSSTTSTTRRVAPNLKCLTDRHAVEDRGPAAAQPADSPPGRGHRVPRARHQAQEARRRPRSQGDGPRRVGRAAS